LHEQHGRVRSCHGRILGVRPFLDGILHRGILVERSSLAPPPLRSYYGILASALATIRKLRVDIGNAIKLFYDNEAGDKLPALLKDHILIGSRHERRAASSCRIEPCGKRQPQQALGEEEEEPGGAQPGDERPMSGGRSHGFLCSLS
jgi:hypothetical protein